MGDIKHHPTALGRVAAARESCCMAACAPCCNVLKWLMCMLQCAHLPAVFGTDVTCRSAGWSCLAATTSQLAARSLVGDVH
jgi:hypothetical protein